MSSFNSEGTLTWHDRVIPGNEVIYGPGDKGVRFIQDELSNSEY